MVFVPSAKKISLASGYDSDIILSKWESRKGPEDLREFNRSIMYTPIEVGFKRGHLINKERFLTG